jgi:hypothetical protein
MHRWDMQHAHKGTENIMNEKISREMAIWDVQLQIEV